jgi:hypothetical protein
VRIASAQPIRADQAAGLPAHDAEPAGALTHPPRATR